MLLTSQIDQSIYLDDKIIQSFRSKKSEALREQRVTQDVSSGAGLPRHIVRQFQSPYTPSPRGLSRISGMTVALALGGRNKAQRAGIRRA
jgi:hypothetical protein